jgi:hypothetical protein
LHGDLRAAGISLVNQRPTAPWEKAEIGQAEVRFSLRDLFASPLPIRVELSSWDLVLRPAAAMGGNENSGAQPGAETSSSSSGPSIRVESLTAQSGEVKIALADDRQIVFENVSFEASNSGGAVWTTQVRTGAISALPLQADGSSFSLRSDPDKITLSDLHVACGAGAIDGDGSVALDEGHAAHAELKALNVPIAMLVAAEWQVKLAGLASGNLIYDAGMAHGKVALSQGRVNFLPWLGNVTALLNLPNFGDTDLDQASADFAWKDHAFGFTNIDVRKNGVARIDGQAVVDAHGQVDGRLRLGLPAAVLAKWPQLQASVFSTTQDETAWADFHLTGTPDHLQEDLSSRVLAVGAQQGGSLIDQAAKSAAALLKNLGQ